MDYADIRVGIYNHLVAEILTVGGRVFWGWVASAETEKPFLSMEFTGEVPSMNTPVGSFMMYDVLVIGEEGNVLAIDPIADSVVSALHEINVTTPDGRIIRSEYRRDARADYWIEDLRGQAIRLAFWLPTDFWT